MSDEAEKAARYDIIETHESAKRRLATLEHVMAKLGERMANFGDTLKYPSRCVFAVDPNLDIRVKRDDTQLKITAQLSKEHMEWESMCRLILDYQQTKQEVARLAGRVRGLGLWATPGPGPE